MKCHVKVSSQKNGFEIDVDFSNCFLVHFVFLYLSKSLKWKGQTFPMVGVISGDTVMQSKPVGRGYVRLKHTGLLPWPGTEKNTEIAAHEFHYGALENLPDNSVFAFRVTRGHGINGNYDGLIVGNALCTFSHHRNIEGNNWVQRFLSFVYEMSTSVHRTI